MSDPGATATRDAPEVPGARLPAELANEVRSALHRAVVERWAERIWERDPSVWTTDERVAGSISERLGWLDAPSHFRERIHELVAFAASVRAEGIGAALVCGMGGSSLAPEVLAHAYTPGAGGIPVGVLDSTDPAAVRAATVEGDPATTLYLIASKSGTTTETLAFLAHFWRLEDQSHGPIPESLPGRHFVAITDPGPSLEAIPHADLFREVFLNPPDVGGRYSALTYVGLVPGALLGIDLEALLGDAVLMAQRCRELERRNPGLALGVTLGSLARLGRDKLTLVIEPEIAAFGAWVEQLVAESTGKRGVGIVPVNGEPLGGPDAYAADRVFVRIGRRDGTWWDETEPSLATLASAGHPVIDLPLAEGEGLGGEFFRWEFATAVAGAVLGVNPFDEPNVTESKENTRRVLEAFRRSGSMPEEIVLGASGRLRLVGDAALRLTGTDGRIESELRRHLDRARPNGYHALHAYVAPSPERDTALLAIRTLLRDRTRRATTVGYGPRFLHSTGQLHKGGAPIGCFLQLVADHADDLEIPRAETFGTLIDAQALGDLASLESHDLPVLRVHLSDDPDAGLAELRAALERAL